RTRIGYGAPTKENTFEAHGSPLGPDELRAAKQRLGWPLEPAFWVPPEALARFRTALGHGRERRVRTLRRRSRRSGRRVPPSGGPQAAARLGRRAAGVSGRRQGCGDAQ